MLTRTFFSLIILVLFTFSTSIGASGDPVRAENGMVVSASKLASDIGIEILKKGGNAIDAAVATGFALAVAYPTAGNLGGGGFMVIHLADSLNTTIDFREKAPKNAFRDMYLDSNGVYLPELGREGFTSSGVPGSVEGLLYALNHYGTMKIHEVIEPAIKLAEEGIVLEYRLAESISSNTNRFLEYPSSAKIFTKNGNPYEENDTLIQKDLARALQLISENGRDGFYKGHVAKLIAEHSKKSGGFITEQDLADYQCVERTPIYGYYKGFDIVTMGPPSSGGIAITQALNALENFNWEKSDWNSSEYIHTLVEILKRVYADRAEHLGDVDYYPVPVDWLTSKLYAQEIVTGIADTATPSEKVNPGIPIPEESEETTHYSVVDKYGNAVSTTVTLNSSYGNKIVVEGAGFLMNNEMDDFSAKPGTPNQFGLLGSEANSIEPGKRMLSSMTPTIVLKQGKPYFVTGSPGGSTIITVVLQTILNVIDFEMDVEQTLYAPRIHHQWMPDKIYFEEYGLSKDVIENLERRGHIMGNIRVLGRAEGILIFDDYFTGTTDPRGYGKASGY
ncbi:MAG: gamma-glutamyltransferase [Melioribacteraceae bacterium]|nr:MAG: gamma-glutamyltransferase [Melioribacteraceae bacterium]